MAWQLEELIFVAGFSGKLDLSCTSPRSTEAAGAQNCPQDPREDWAGLEVLGRGLPDW
jgi:hypothetical protein